MHLGETVLLDTLRYGHILSGILWIGLLYYFNFVQVPSFPKMEAAARQNVILNLVPTALFYFRWAALFTFLFGVAYILAAGSGVGTVRYWDQPQFYNILIGGTLGTIMASNVWFIIWPLQKKIITATRATVEQGTPAPPEQAGWTRTVLLASRTNTMMSIPMLFFMIAARHLPQLWS